MNIFSDFFNMLLHPEDFLEFFMAFLISLTIFIVVILFVYLGYDVIWHIVNKPTTVEIVSGEVIDKNRDTTIVNKVVGKIIIPQSITDYDVTVKLDDVIFTENNESFFYYYDVGDTLNVKVEIYTRSDGTLLRKEYSIYNGVE